MPPLESQSPAVSATTSGAGVIGEGPASRFRGRTALRASPRSEAFVFWGPLIYLAASTIEGVLRFALAAVHLAPLLYLRDVFALVVVMWHLRMCLREGKLAGPLQTVLLLLVLWALVGFTYASNVAQVFFGFKMFLPLMLGIASYPVVRARIQSASRFILGLWLIAVCGLFASALVRMPWVGESYELGGVEIEGSKEWGISGADRLAGFSRASFSVANQVLFFSVWIACFSRFRLVRLAVWFASASAIVLTTSRSALMGFAATTAFLCLQSLAGSLHRVWKCLIPLAAILMVAVPVLPPSAFSFLEPFANGGRYRGPAASFFDRVDDTWPGAFEMVATAGNWLTGRGLGGIGMAQKYFEPDMNNPADNLFVYLFVIFGPASIVLLGLIVLRMRCLYIPGDATALHGACVGLGVIVVGITLNCVEDQCVSFFAGGLLCRLFGTRDARRRRPVRPRNEASPGGRMQAPGLG